MLGSFKKLLFEDGVKAEPEKAVPVAAAMPETEANQRIQQGPDGSFYEKLGNLTAFFNTDAGKAVDKYYTALAVLPDVDLRLRTAISQAKALDGLTEQAISDAFDSLEQKLQEDGTKFASALGMYTGQEITERKAHLEQLTAQVDDLRKEIASEAEKLTTAQTNAATSEAQYRAASSRRASEIAQERAKILTLAKG